LGVIGYVDRYTGYKKPKIALKTKLYPGSQMENSVFSSRKNPRKRKNELSCGLGKFNVRIKMKDKYNR